VARRHASACPHQDPVRRVGSDSGTEPQSRTPLVAACSTSAAVAPGARTSDAVPGLHRSCNLLDDEMVALLRHSVDLPERLLPLPQLRRPTDAATPPSISNRLRGRRKRRQAVLRSALSIALQLGWLYCSARSPLLPGPPVELKDMCDVHRQAWLRLLGAASELCEARRG